jgi:LPXTG-site transpeptidase (sortase) family protein
MNSNPLFPSSKDDIDPPDRPGYVLRRQERVIPRANTPVADTAAIDLIRDKLDRIYADEPEASAEINEVATATKLSKHQKFMQELQRSGKNLAEIQTEWHNYYVNLPDDQKHQVWHEFYESNTAFAGAKPVKDEESSVLPAATNSATRANAPTRPSVSYQPQVVASAVPSNAGERSPAEIKSTIRHKALAATHLQGHHNIQSILFGLSSGVVVLIIFLFGFFNEVIITPFIQPSRHVSATPIIVDTASIAASGTNEIIIPKINVEIPVDYSQTSTNEATIENALENGIVHYPSTVLPGQDGNAAFFGHSSNNIFNKGKYKFAFVLLHELVNGDTFYITNNGTVYIYKVISRQIVSPNDVSVLDNIAGQTATATLITCDPPGTSLNRLIVVGQQISPDPTTNSGTAGQTTSATPTATVLPGNGPTMLHRLWDDIF